MKSWFKRKVAIIAATSFGLIGQVSGSVYITNSSGSPLQYSITEFQFGTITNSWVMSGTRFGQIITYFTDGSVDYQPINEVVSGSGTDYTYVNQSIVSAETIQPGDSLVLDDYTDTESYSYSESDSEDYYDFTSNGEADIVTAWNGVYYYDITVSNNIAHAYSSN